MRSEHGLNSTGGGAGRRGNGRARRNLKTAEIVAREIVDDIADRGLDAGSFLGNEADLLDQYEVSRASLREAMRILEVYGLIEIKVGPNGGPFIVDLTASDFGRTATFYLHALGARFRELSESRLMLEPMMARLAAERHGDEEPSRLLVNVKESRMIPSDQSRERVRATREFHSMVADLAGNLVLNLVSSSFKEIFAMYTSRQLTDHEFEGVVRAHEKIAEAIVRGDADAAEDLMRTHMERSNSDFEERYPRMVDETVNWI